MFTSFSERMQYVLTVPETLPSSTASSLLAFLNYLFIVMFVIFRASYVLQNAETIKNFKKMSQCICNFLDFQTIFDL